MNYRYPIFVLVWLAATLLVSDCVAQDADEIVRNVLAYYRSTDEVVFKNAGPIRVRQQGKGMDSKEVILHWSDDGFLFAADYGYVSHFLISNPEYWADIQANLTGTKRSNTFRIPDLKGSSFGLANFGEPETFVSSIRPTILSHIGAAFFAVRHGREKGKSMGGPAEVLNDGNGAQGWTEIKLSGWPDGDGEFLLRVDQNSGQVFGFTGFIGEIKIKCDVEEFTDLDGVQLPCSTRMQSFVPNARSSAYKTTWEHISEDVFGYDPEQLYLTYYGLPEPELDSLPQRSKFPWLAIGGALAVVFVGVVVWRWRRNA
jgi:hypothetical protein